MCKIMYRNNNISVVDLLHLLLTMLAGNCRYDSSLGLLTKKFVNLVEAAPDGVLDLNKAADALQVSPHSVYCVSNH